MSPNMLKTKYKRPIPNVKLTTEPANGPVTSYIMDREEMNAKYGPYKTPERKRCAR